MAPPRYTGVMNIDERLEKLVERHEALAQSMELMQIEGDGQRKRIDTLASVVDRHEHEQERFRKAMRAGLLAWLDEGENGQQPS